MSFVEQYELLLAGAAFLGGWAVSMLTGLVLTKAL